MEPVLDLLKISLPAAIVAYAIYLVVKTFLNKKFEENYVSMQLKNKDQFMPLRIQAYERMALFLERITPNQLILRLNDGSYTVAMLQQVLITDIREEFNHNLAQQIYMSDPTWEMVRIAVEDVVALINTVAQQLDRDAPGIELAKGIFQHIIDTQDDRTARALKVLKAEARELF